MAVLVTAIHADMKREIAPKAAGIHAIQDSSWYGAAWMPVTSTGMTAS
jgi:hypothetical protein